MLLVALSLWCSTGRVRSVSSRAGWARIGATSRTPSVLAIEEACSLPWCPSSGPATAAAGFYNLCSPSTRAKPCMVYKPRREPRGEARRPPAVDGRPWLPRSREPRTLECSGCGWQEWIVQEERLPAGPRILPSRRRLGLSGVRAARPRPQRKRDRARAVGRRRRQMFLQPEELLLGSAGACIRSLAEPPARASSPVS